MSYQRERDEFIGRMSTEGLQVTDGAIPPHFRKADPVRTHRSRVAALVVGIALALVATAATAQSKVYVTEHGKKYHTSADCRSLRSSTVKTIDLKDIGDRTLCTICAHRKAKS
jgi:hypothetical protein